MNNKGFAVSSVLYAILICFLMFLGAAMAIFSSSNSLVVAANDDIINGTAFKANWVSATMSEDPTAVSNILIRVNSRYGTLNWPKDWPSDCTGNCIYKNINVDTVDTVDTNAKKVIFKDKITNKSIECTSIKRKDVTDVNGNPIYDKECKNTN